MAFKLKNLNRVVHLRLDDKMASYVAQNGSEYVRNLILKDMISKGEYHHENEQTNLDDLLQQYRVPRH